MPKFLSRGDEITLRDGQKITVIEELGAGGQGTVYRVKVNGSNEEYALKWYFRGCIDAPKKFYNHLAENIADGAPSGAFIWAKQLTGYVEGETFGYIMRIIPRRFKSLALFLTARVRFANVRAMVNAGLNIAAAIQKLNEKGYSYKDLNDDNIFVDPNDGKVLICDTDNVTREGNLTNIIGKPNYIAPEVLRGEKMPDRYTDRHALAVILFMLLVGDHPLAGKRTVVPILTDRLDKKFFGTEPLFIFDDKDRSNAPHPALHRNALTMWKFLPSFMKDFFRRAFSQEVLLHGATNPARRPNCQEWINALMCLKSSIARCPKCGAEMFLESKQATTCYGCNTTFRAVGHLAFSGRQNFSIPIYKNILLYDYEDFINENAVILEQGSKIGLRNKSGQIWRIGTPSGEFVKKPGDVLVLGSKFKIDFGNGNVAQVVANK